MFKRKIESYLETYLNSDEERILCIDGARQIGKSYIIRALAKKYYTNYVEVNMIDDCAGDRLFADVKNKDEFYLQLSILHGDKLKDRENTIVFLDEIQVYPHLLTMLKSLRYDNRFKYICSGSLLGVTLHKTTSIPMGSILEKEMYPMDFEEFLWACGVGNEFISYMKQCYEIKESLNESMHNKILNLFKTYLYVGGLPDAIKAYVETKNVYNIREVQTLTHKYYREDAGKYDEDNRLVIQKMYDYIPSNIENKVKRIQFTKIENQPNARFKNYEHEFEYLISSGIALPVSAIAKPSFPLIQSSKKNLIKLYMNDVGLFTNILYSYNVNAILKDEVKVNLGAVYETVVTQELKAHGHNLYYYDRRKVGEVDYLIDDYSTLSVIPIEIKSGRDGYEFSALKKVIAAQENRIQKGYVFSNDRVVKEEKNIVYMPIYYIMFV